MVITRNPFHFGDGLSPNDLVGRNDQVAQVENTIRDGGRLFLIGPRRFGKTSILRAAEENLSKNGAMVLRVNAEVVPSTRMLVERIITAAAIRLKECYEDSYEQAGRFFSPLRPEFSASAVEEKISVRIGMDTYADEHRQLEALTNTLDCLDRMAAAQPKARPVGIIIDEFSALSARDGVMAEAMIRSVTQQHQHLAYVFTGSLTRLMTDMTGKHDRPFCRSGSVCHIGPVPAIEFAF
jgi:hypothetical protein